MMKAKMMAAGGMSKKGYAAGGAVKTLAKAMTKKGYAAGTTQTLQTQANASQVAAQKSLDRQAAAGRAAVTGGMIQTPRPIGMAAGDKGKIAMAKGGMAVKTMPKKKK